MAYELDKIDHYVLFFPWLEKEVFDRMVSVVSETWEVKQIANATLTVRVPSLADAVMCRLQIEEYEPSSIYEVKYTDPPTLIAHMAFDEGAPARNRDRRDRRVR